MVFVPPTIFSLVSWCTATSINVRRGICSKNLCLTLTCSLCNWSSQELWNRFEQLYSCQVLIPWLGNIWKADWLASDTTLKRSACQYWVVTWSECLFFLVFCTVEALFCLYLPYCFKNRGNITEFYILYPWQVNIGLILIRDVLKML